MKILILIVSILTLLSLNSCYEMPTFNNPYDKENELTTGILIVQSSPVNAQIWIDGTNTGKVTPDTIKTISAGSHSLTLKLDGYKDTVQTNVTITAGSTTNRNITLIRASSTFGPIRLWETTGTTAAQPSGLDLSSGATYGVSSADNGKIDIYYSSTGFVVRSANAATGLTRITSFFIGSGTNINDGLDSPSVTGSWVSQMGDRVVNYVFLFDNDQHYSKLKIVSFGGGVPGTPAWIEVQFIYNEQANSRVF